MKPLDRFLQTARIRQAIKHIPDGSRVLDIGSYNGRLFEMLGPRLGAGVSIDPHIESDAQLGKVQQVSGSFPNASLRGPFDCICMLAVIEHIPRDRHEEVAQACWALLKPGGALIITVPSPLVDRITAVLALFRLIDGIDLDQHYRCDPREVVATFSSLFDLRECKRFEFGLNNLISFVRSDQQTNGVGDRHTIGIDRDRSEQ